MWVTTELSSVFGLPPIIIEDDDTDHTPFYHTVGGERSGDLNPMWGREHSDKTKSLMRERAKGRDHSYHSKAVSLIKDGEVRHFKSRAEAARELGLRQPKVSEVMNGKRNHTGGWMKYA
jgi:hypothetical protein